MNTAAERNADARSSFLRRPRVRLGAVVAVAIAAALVVVAVTRDNGNTNSTPSTPATAATSANGPVGMTPSQLRNEARSLKQPIYWAGAKPGYTYEFTRTTNGSIYVRYLPPGVDVGAKDARYLIVATYPFPNAYKALTVAAGKKGVKIPHHGLALVHQHYPESVHVAFPKTSYQVEVYDPSPARSLSVARSGNVAPLR